MIDSATLAAAVHVAAARSFFSFASVRCRISDPLPLQCWQLLALAPELANVD
jgi:hypothetical protein